MYKGKKKKINHNVIKIEFKVITIVHLLKIKKQLPFNFIQKPGS